VPGEVCGRHRRQRSETGRFGRCSRRIPTNVGWLPEWHWTNRAAVHSRGEHAGEEPPVEAAVTTVNGLPADRWIKLRLVAKLSFFAVKGIVTNGRAKVYCRKFQRPICVGNPIFRSHPKALNSADYI